MISITRPTMSLRLNGVEISRHRSAVEAMESAAEHGAGTYTLVRPDATITVSGELVEPEPTPEPAPDPDPVPGQQLAGITIEDSAGGVGRPVVLALPLREGALGAGEAVAVRGPGGSLLPSQWSSLTSWRTDGSQLHGILVFDTPGQGDSSGAYTLEKGVSVDGPGITMPDLANWIGADKAKRDAVVSVVIGGESYSLALSALLDETIAPTKSHAHFIGPMCSSFCLGHRLIGAPSGIQVHFEARAFGGSGAVNRMYCVIALENTGLDTTLSTTSADSISITLGGSVIRSYTGFDLLADARYISRGWSGGDPGVWAGLSPGYIQGTGLVPSYRDVTLGSPTELSHEWNTTDVISSTALHSAGGKPELAPYDRAAASYLVSGSQAHQQNAVVIADALQEIVSNFGAGCFRPRSEITGHPMDLSVDRRCTGVAGHFRESDRFPASRDTAVSVTDHAHMPSMGYVAYLATGEFTHLESLLFSAVAAWINERPGGFLGTIDSKQYGAWGQVRSIAWTLRSITDAGCICPDDHPLKTTMVAGVGRALSEINTRIRPLDITDSLGLVLTAGVGAAVAYSREGAGRIGLAPWMDDWLTWAIGHAYELGWKRELDDSGLWQWKAQAILGRFGVQGGYCWDKSAAYSLAVRDTESDPFYSSWSEIFSKNFPETTSCEAVGGSMSGDSGANYYGAQMAPALAAVASLDIEAWEVYDARSRSWSPEGAPEWAIVPRSAEATL